MKLRDVFGHGRWRAGALAAVMMLSGGTAVAESKNPKLDVHLRQRITHAGDRRTPIEVIVTVRRGARKGLARKLKAMGGRVNADFTIIEASAVTLPLNKLRQLARDKDVLAVSVNADVAPTGIATAVTGTALNGGYSLRSTLGLRGVSATATTKAFQRGNANGYGGTLDTGVDSLAPATDYSTTAAVSVRGGSQAAGMLVKFDDVFGDGAGQIPPGSTIASASLRIYPLDAVSGASPLRLHRMVANWTGATNWNSLTTSGDGLQFDNVEAAAGADAVLGTGANTFAGAALTASVQSWANGQPNHGWVVFQNSPSPVRVSTAQEPAVSRRPVLTVTYKAPVNATPLTGSGVTVAVIDSGLLEDGGGTTRIKTTRDFTRGALNPPHIAPVDDYGHGTHIAGLIGGNKSEVEGVAPGVRFVSLRVLDRVGAGSTSHVITALQWAIANKKAQGIDVVNLSLGHPIYEPAATDPLVQAVEAATRAGITVVVSAGNIGTNEETNQIGYAGITSPGNAPAAITVGASRTLGTTSRTDDLVSAFSSRGPTWYDAFAKPDVVAPGQRLLSAATTTQTLYTKYEASRGPSYGGRAYLYLSGTSMSAGVVSGTVALMIEHAKLQFDGARPTSNALKAMLQKSAFPITDATGQVYDVLTQGAGALNAIGAAQLAGALDPRVGVGHYWVTGDMPNTTTIDGQVISWGDSIVWGDNIVWGDALDTRLAAWSDNIVWGDDDNIVWGDTLTSRSSHDNIVWGDNVTWGGNIVWGDSLDVIGAKNENIVWGDVDNIVWGDSDNIVWGDDDNIVWGDDDNIVWGDDDNIVWGDRDNIVWGDRDNIVWGDSTSSVTE